MFFSCLYSYMSPLGVGLPATKLMFVDVSALFSGFGPYFLALLVAGTQGEHQCFAAHVRDPIGPRSMCCGCSKSRSWPFFTGLCSASPSRAATIDPLKVDAIFLSVCRWCVVYCCTCIAPPLKTAPAHQGLPFVKATDGAFLCACVFTYLRP